MGTFTFIAGPNACGKTSLDRDVLNGKPWLGERLNPDEIEQEQNVSTGKASRIAVLQKKDILHRVCFGNCNAHQETTLSQRGFRKDIKTLRKANCRILMYYVILESPKLAFERHLYGRTTANDRIQELSPEQVEERFYKSVKNFPAAFIYCDYVEVYDNTNGMVLAWIYDNGRIYYKNPLLPPSSMALKLLYSVSESING
jgi:predicted ABC-type ATPase